jgi:SapC
MAVRRASPIEGVDAPSCHEGTGQVTTQLLIYRDAVPVSRERHQDCFIEAGDSYRFSAEVNSVPLMVAEIPFAADEYPVVFGAADPMAAVILGFRNDENLILNPDGSWGAKYIPAFIRRYPFVFSQVEDRLVLYLDEAFSGVNRAGRGQPLFKADGAPSPYIEGILKFLRDYQAQFDLTRRFGERLRALGLLEPTQSEVKLDNGQAISLTGFAAVNRDRLKALPPETTLEMARSDELELIHLHLHSLRRFELLGQRLALRMHVPPTPRS